VPQRTAFRWDDIFPIADEPSARLMKIKAACLKRAGIISAWQKSEIERRADQMIAESVTPKEPQRGRKRRESAECHAA
jgi:hypothetical protein